MLGGSGRVGKRSKTSAGQSFGHILEDHNALQEFRSMDEFGEAQLVGQRLCDTAVFLCTLRELLQLIFQTHWGASQEEVAVGSTHHQQIV